LLHFTCARRASPAGHFDLNPAEPRLRKLLDTFAEQAHKEQKRLAVHIHAGEGFTTFENSPPADSFVYEAKDKPLHDALCEAAYFRTKKHDVSEFKLLARHDKVRFV
jgi:hypothetical protein